MRRQAGGDSRDVTQITLEAVVIAKVCVGALTPYCAGPFAGALSWSLSKLQFANLPKMPDLSFSL